MAYGGLIAMGLATEERAAHKDRWTQARAECTVIHLITEDCSISRCTSQMAFVKRTEHGWKVIVLCRCLCFALVSCMLNHWKALMSWLDVFHTLSYQRRRERGTFKPQSQRNTRLKGGHVYLPWLMKVKFPKSAVPLTVWCPAGRSVPLPPLGVHRSYSSAPLCWGRSALEWNNSAGSSVSRSTRVETRAPVDNTNSAQ